MGLLLNRNVLMGLAFIAIVAGSYGTGYLQARRACELNMEKAARQFREKQDKLIVELEKERKKRKVVYRERIKTVKEAADDSGCTDAPVPDDIVRAILPKDRTEP